jgi:hypothetical protein
LTLSAGGTRARSASGPPNRGPWEAHSFAPATTAGLGLARWESQEQLDAFWEATSPLEFPGAVLLSIEILEEVDHLTLED